jgi:hypothetical protein
MPVSGIAIPSLVLFSAPAAPPTDQNPGEGKILE